MIENLSNDVCLTAGILHPPRRQRESRGLSKLLLICSGLSLTVNLAIPEFSGAPRSWVPLLSDQVWVVGGVEEEAMCL